MSATFCGLDHAGAAPCRACAALADQHERVGQIFAAPAPAHDPRDSDGQYVRPYARVRLADGRLGRVESTSADGKRAHVKARGSLTTTLVATETLRLAPVVMTRARVARRAAR